MLGLIVCGTIQNFVERYPFRPRLVISIGLDTPYI